MLPSWNSDIKSKLWTLSVDAYVCEEHPYQILYNGALGFRRGHPQQEEEEQQEEGEQDE